jgi:hypothetical protein
MEELSGDPAQEGVMAILAQADAVVLAAYRMAETPASPAVALRIMREMLGAHFSTDGIIADRMEARLVRMRRTRIYFAQVASIADSVSAEIRHGAELGAHAGKWHRYVTERLKLVRLWGYVLLLSKEGLLYRYGFHADITKPAAGLLNLVAVPA